MRACERRGRWAPRPCGYQIFIIIEFISSKKKRYLTELAFPSLKQRRAISVCTTISLTDFNSATLEVVLPCLEEIWQITTSRECYRVTGKLSSYKSTRSCRRRVFWLMSDPGNTHEALSCNLSNLLASKFVMDESHGWPLSMCFIL